MHTLYDELALTQDPKVALVLKGILESGNVWDKFPVRTVNTLEIKNLRWAELPSIDFAFIAEAYGEGVGKVEPISYGLAVIGHDIDIPRVYAKEVGNHIIDPKQLGIEMTTQALNFKLNNVLFNGDKAADPRAFDGLKKLSTALPSRQTVNAGLAAYGGDGTSLNIIAGGASSDIRHGFLDALNRGKQVVEGSAPSLMVMNENVYALFESILRREKLFDTAQDQFEREVMRYRKIPFVDAGYGDIKGNTLIIANDHDVPGDAVKRTSVYFIRLDAQRHVGVLQTKGLEVREMGEHYDKPVLRWRMDWTCGLPVWGERSISRVKGLKVEA